MALYSLRMTEAESRSRLARFVEQRITELAADYVVVAERAGFSIETLAKIRKGRKVKASTYGKLERGLEWRRGSVDAIFRGEEPAVDTSVPSHVGVQSPSTQLVEEIAAAQASSVDEDDPVVLAVSAMLGKRSLEYTADVLDRVLRAYPPEQQEEIIRRLLGKEHSPTEQPGRRAG